jgi:prepilin-type processing-associated H-X9-DG protein
MANYIIIGDDGKEYGPVSVEDVRKWAAEGRAGAHTKVRIDGTNEWRLLSEVPELAAGSKLQTPPPRPIAAPRPAGRTSGMAITSLVLGILGLVTCGFTALIGLVLGIIALVRIGKSRGELEGKGLAISGTILSALFMFMIPFFLAMFLPALAAAKQKAQQINCMNNEKQLALAALSYSQTHTNHLPPAAAWCDALKESAGAPQVFKCPAANVASPCGYAFNDRLGGMDVSGVNSQTVLIFEADSGWNAHGGLEMASPRHLLHGKGSMNVAFMDGHVQIVSEAQFASLRWNP